MQLLGGLLYTMCHGGRHQASTWSLTSMIGEKDAGAVRVSTCAWNTVGMVCKLGVFTNDVHSTFGKALCDVTDSETWRPRQEGKRAL
jgi:hypothetical protein